MITFCKLFDVETGRLERHFTPADVSEIRKAPGKVVWLDVLAPDDADLELLAAEFGFHPLALEDCRHAHQRPKIETFPDYAFLVFYQARLGREDVVEPLEIQLFVGESYVVSVHPIPVPLLREVESRWERAEITSQDSAAYLAYMILDAAVDSYFPLLDTLAETLDDLEDRVFDSPTEDAVSGIFKLKKQALVLRRLIAPLRDVVLTLLRRESRLIGPQTLPYYQDVLDHLLRISDAIDLQRDLASGALEAYLSTTANRTNETMKKLTVLSTVLMTVGIIAGVYGMNFAHMPELQWTWGYPYALGLMAASALGLTLAFRLRGYF